jgi:arylsulfatase
MAPTDRPNILWYCTDQQRFDTIHALGNPQIHTPVLDGLVSNGIAFNRAYTQSPICTPSRASFLTGRYPAAHHVHRNGNDVFPESERLVTRILADSGYDCALAGKLHLSRAKGRVEIRPDDGYRRFHWSHHPAPDWPAGHGYDSWLRDEKRVDPIELFASYRGKEFGVPAELHQTTWCTEMALRFLDEPRGGPWLLSLNPFDPHPPFDAPEEYLRRYDPETLPLPIAGPDDVEHQRRLAGIDQQTREAIRFGAPADPDANARDNDPNRDRASEPPRSYDPRQVKASYYGMIELIDTQLGRLLDRLESTGEIDNTIVVFTSDHGELLGDHGLLYKGCRFYDGLVRVPLIISWPAKWKSGLEANGLVELVDIAPTLLEAAGLEIPAGMQGRSLAPVLAGETSADEIKRHVTSEYWDAIVCPDGRQDHTHATMFFDGRMKSVIYHGHRLGELYDLEADPHEISDLWGRSGAASLQAEITARHFDAYAATSWAGIDRTGQY